MENQKLLQDPPQKVLLMYQAVVDMINEGWDVNTMKVSDITARAGIGKGTAYEYFSSKEEIITMALSHDVWKKQAEMEKIVDGQGSFEEKIKLIFEYLERQLEKMQTFCTLVRISTGSFEIADGLQQQCRNLQCDELGRRVDASIDRFMEQGIQEGIITQENVYLRRSALVAQIMAYTSYLVAKEQRKDIPISNGEVKRFAYESLIKSLNG